MTRRRYGIGWASKRHELNPLALRPPGPARRWSNRDWEMLALEEFFADPKGWIDRMNQAVASFNAAVSRWVGVLL